ncbi:MAG: hypothetical protein WBP94_05565 [Rhodomicrobiaceae bacterium]
MAISDLLGYLAASMVALTFCCRTMLTLRCCAIVSNILFIAYAAKMDLVPILMLHVALLPVNATYLVSELRKAAASRYCKALR